jgi:hypothetical protein
LPLEARAGTLVDYASLPSSGRDPKILLNSNLHKKGENVSSQWSLLFDQSMLRINSIHRS